MTAVKGGVTTTYKYGADGLRTQKTVGSTVYNYYYADGRLVRQTWGSNYMDFLYDESGNAYSFVYNGTQYYYVRNLQGDVVKILNTSGAVVASYTYDAWGKVTSSGSIGQINPIRYRGYYYDTDTGFYYLQSRYYDPTAKRFISADTVVSGVGGELLGYNQYAYCFNNPINMTDETGSWPTWEDIKAKGREIDMWIDTNIIQPVEGFFADCRNYDSNNQSEEVVFESNYFSNYKGSLVIKTNAKASFSFGWIFLSRNQQTSDILKHEYGHTCQLKNEGIVKYIKNVVIPSVTINILDRQEKLPYNYYSYPWEAEANQLGGSKSTQPNKPDLPPGGYTSYWDLILLFFEK